jgi:hypothetical protein
MSGRPCLWENGDIAGRGDRQQIDGFQVIDLEFIAVPNTADYWLAPQGLKPFEANYSDKGNDDGTGAVHPPIFSGWCDLKLRRSKILASWPASAEISGKERRGRSPSPYYVPFRNWLLEQYISGRLSIDDDVAPAVLGIRGAWGRHCEVTKVAKAARPLPKERRLREVMGKIREEARAAKDD